jgi:hypothetical protein
MRTVQARAERRWVEGPIAPRGRRREHEGVTRNGAPARIVVALAAAALLACALPAGSARASHIAPFVGSWANVDAGTGGITRFEIRAEGASLVVEAWGRCHPTDCVWGPAAAGQRDVADGRFSVVWRPTFAIIRVDLALEPGGLLRATHCTTFTDGSGRPNRCFTEHYARRSPPVAFHAVEVRVVGPGSVRGSVGIACPDVCALEAEAGTSIELRAEPEPRTYLRGWTGACTSSSLSCRVALAGPVSVTATFVRPSVALVRPRVGARGRVLVLSGIASERTQLRVELTGPARFLTAPAPDRVASTRRSPYLGGCRRGGTSCR